MTKAGWLDKGHIHTGDGDNIPADIYFFTTKLGDGTRGLVARGTITLERAAGLLAPLRDVPIEASDAEVRALLRKIEAELLAIDPTCFDPGRRLRPSQGPALPE